MGVTLLAHISNSLLLARLCFTQSEALVQIVGLDKDKGKNKGDPRSHERRKGICCDLGRTREAMILIVLF